MDTENKKLVEDQEKLKIELKKTSDGNFVCVCEKGKNYPMFYAVTYALLFYLKQNQWPNALWPSTDNDLFINFCSNMRLKHCAKRNMFCCAEKHVGVSDLFCKYKCPYLSKELWAWKLSCKHIFAKWVIFLVIMYYFFYRSNHKDTVLVE